MFLKVSLFFLCFCSIFHAYGDENADLLNDRVTAAIMRILAEQPSTVENWIEDRVYLDPEKIAVTRSGVVAFNEFSIVEIPQFAIDQCGPYLLCSNAEINQQAQQHYDNATKSTIEAFGHSCGAAGALFTIPPLSIYEGYKAVEALKNAATEYIRGLQVEGKILPGVNLQDLPPIQGINPNLPPIGGLNGK